MSEIETALPQTGGSEPAPSDSVGGREQNVITPDRSPKESVRDSLSKAFDEVAKTKEPEKAETAPEPEADQPEETAEQKAERLRDEQGRFAKAQEKAEQKVVAEQKPGKVTIDPPVHWKGEQKLKWANVPNEIKAAIAEDAKQRQEIEAKASQLDQVLTPQRRQALQVAYGSETQGLNQILATVEFSNTDPVGFVRWFARNRGIDIGSLAPSQPQGQQPGLPPELEQYLKPVLSKVTTLEQQLQQSQSAAQQAETARVQQELQSFFADHVNHPFAQDVRADMAGFLSSGQAANLKEAYDKAVWANPSTRAKVMAAQQAKAREEQEKLAAQKRNSSVSVTGAPGVATPLAKAPNLRPENPRDTVRRVLSEQGHRIN